jgi:hypothetical protein
MKASGTNLRSAFGALLLVLLAACASSGGPLVEPGPNPAGGDLRIDSEMEWTRYSEMRSQLWTMDGQPLNLLYLIPGVREGEYIFLGSRQTRRRPDGPFFRSGMRADEVRDLIVDGLLAAGLVGVQTQDLRPDDFGGREGLRFEMTMTNQQGLKYQGMAAAFEHDQRLALALFLAPSEYYYPRDADKVARMLDSLRLEQ